MEQIFTTIKKETHTLKLPTSLCLSGYGCSVFKINGKIKKDQNTEDEEFYLCSNFSKEIIVGEILLPVLTEIPWSRSPIEENEIVIDEQFDKVTWIPVTRDHVEEIKLYICNSQGNIPSFESVKLMCKLVFIPHVDSL